MRSEAPFRRKPAHVVTTASRSGGLGADESLRATENTSGGDEADEWFATASNRQLGVDRRPWHVQEAMVRRRAALTADQVASGHRRPCAKLRVMAVIAIAEMFGISGRRAELATLLERFGGWAGGEPGCRRYIFAATLTDPSRFVLVSEWETQEALDAHYRSEAFADFQLSLDGLLARPSESTVYSAEASVRPLNTRPMDPRDAD